MNNLLAPHLSQNAKAQKSLTALALSPSTIGTPPLPELTHDGSSDVSTNIDTQEPEPKDLGFGPQYERQEGEYFDDETAEFLENTRDQTPKEDVLQLKQKYLNEKKKAIVTKKELNDMVASLRDEQERRLQMVKEWNEEYARLNQRGKPNPPNLKDRNLHYLYDNTVDRLRECTVHIYLQQSRDLYTLGRYSKAEVCAKDALDHSKALHYEPLSALCHFYVGKAQHKQRAYIDAVSSFKHAASGARIYFTQEELETRVQEAADDLDTVSCLEGSESFVTVRRESSARSMDSRVSTASTYLE